MEAVAECALFSEGVDLTAGCFRESRTDEFVGDSPGLNKRLEGDEMVQLCLLEDGVADNGAMNHELDVKESSQDVAGKSRVTAGVAEDEAADGWLGDSFKELGENHCLRGRNAWLLSVECCIEAALGEEAEGAADI